MQIRQAPAAFKAKFGYGAEHKFGKEQQSDES